MPGVSEEQGSGPVGLRDGKAHAFENPSTDRCTMQRIKRVSFDGNSSWCGDHSLQSLPAIVGTEDIQLAPTPLPDAAHMDEVSPLIRSIFEGRKKLINSSSDNVTRNLGGANARSKKAPQKEKELAVREYEETMRKKVDALEEEITIFKNESKRLKKVAKEHEDALRKLARERVEWEQQKKIHIQAFQAQQEEQTERLKKEKKLLEYKSMSLGLPAAQRKEADDLKATLAKQTEEHNGKEKRLRLTAYPNHHLFYRDSCFMISSHIAADNINYEAHIYLLWSAALQSKITRLRAMNEDLTRQVLEMRKEIERYESCLLADLDGRDNGWQVKADCKKPCGDANHKPIDPKHIPDEATREKRSRGHPSTEENYDSSTPRGSEHMKTKTTPSLLCEQASLLSDLFKRPWKATRDYEMPSSRCASDLARWR